MNREWEDGEPMLKPTRRIVTGQRNGKSAVIFDGRSTNRQVNPLVPDTGVTILWKSEAVPTDNSGVDDAAGETFGLRQTEGGADFMIFQCAPHVETQRRAKEAGGDAWLAPGMLPAGTQTDSRAHPGMHRHDTTDFITMISGEITLILEDGEVTLKPGDTLVNRGSLHAWENRGDAPAILSAVSLGARRSG